jgi:hypothetical protein
MTVNYWALFKLGLLVFCAMLFFAWIPDGIHGFNNILPSRSHTGEYNRAAIVLIVIGLVGIGRMLRKGGGF